MSILIKTIKTKVVIAMNFLYRSGVVIMEPFFESRHGGTLLSAILGVLISLIIDYFLKKNGISTQEVIKNFLTFLKSTI